MAELPPRARRIPDTYEKAKNRAGTTSACAENTKPILFAILFHRNYLRVRGEYSVVVVRLPLVVELPPRARRIPIHLLRARPRQGTTSACAENTRAKPHPTQRKGNYLRVRGEYRVTLDSIADAEELPPRARRIQSRVSKSAVSPGTTSACAENTCCSRCYLPRRWNYLRVRGEYPK